ncbi:hypothetical protein [Marinirhabdus gelatinilytica]|nr:hypothetical protein [Marinirhabdus gelatinilytica]
MKLSVLPLIAAFVALGFSPSKEVELNSSSIFISETVGEPTYVPYEFEVNMNPEMDVPFLGKSYLGFTNDLGFSESSGNYKAVNRLGYVGKYQFGWSALKWVGVNSKRMFLNNPDLQEEAFSTLISLNKWVLKDHIAKYRGQHIGGIQVTESGLIAAAHLGGAGNVIKFLESNGENVFADANNVPITKYMKRFGGYDLSSIAPDNNARVTL